MTQLSNFEYLMPYSVYKHQNVSILFAMFICINMGSRVTSDVQDHQDIREQQTVHEATYDEKVSTLSYVSFLRG